MALIGLMVLQGQQYRSFELAKNRDPETERSSAFLSAFAVHPVSEGTLMYRLHKRFSALELERAYSEIEQLQVSRGSGLQVGGHFRPPGSQMNKRGGWARQEAADCTDPTSVRSTPGRRGSGCPG